MSDSARRTPLQWLKHLERVCLQHARGLPKQQQTDETWLGIGFRLGDLQLVAPLNEVAEILVPPALSKVPRTKAWVCGIANVRGNLMPIMDLQGYLYDQPPSLNRRSRILAVSHNDVYTGLVVDAVLGLKHFRSDEQVDELPAGDSCVKQYMTHSFRSDDALWGVFSMYSLAETPQFMQAAI
jgi:twitching motility protein PilI